MLNAPMKIAPGTSGYTAIGIAADDDKVIPTMNNGEKPKYVACVHDGAQAQQSVRIEFGGLTATAAAAAVTASTGFQIPAHECVIFDVSGYDTYAIIASIAAVDFTMTPLENF